jgi:hypothetical protein
MLTYFTRFFLSFILLVSLSLAQTTPPDDFSGIWTIDGVTGLGATAAAENTARDLAAGRLPQFGFMIGEPPMQPWAVERYKLDRVGTVPSDGGNDNVDPVMYPYCLPEGLGRSYTISPFEIVHAPNIVYMLFERNHQDRRIYTDGKKRLEGYTPSFMGNALGRWEGKTLAVETDNFEALEGYNKLDTFGHPFTDKLRVSERITRPAQDTLQIEFTFDDPGAYTKPWGGTKVFKLKPDWEMTEQTVCEDHLREKYIRDMRNNTPSGTP